VNHLVDDDVFEAFARFPRKICVQPDAPSIRIAASPFRLHPLYEDAFHLYGNDRRPVCDKPRDGSLDLLSASMRSCAPGLPNTALPRCAVAPMRGSFTGNFQPGLVSNEMLRARKDSSGNWQTWATASKTALSRASVWRRTFLLPWGIRTVAVDATSESVWNLPAEKLTSTRVARRPRPTNPIGR